MKNIEEKIMHLEKKLNDIKIVEEKWYRRNHCAYDMVCYINNIIALHNSGNYEYIPVFVRRVKKFLLRKALIFLNSEYIDFVIKYIELMEIKLTNQHENHDNRLQTSHRNLRSKL